MLLLVVRQRATRRRYRLAVAPRWQDVAKIVGAGAVLFAFVATLDRYGGIPVPVLLLLVLLGVFSWIATQTVFGRRIYAVGSNLEATRLSGVDTDRVKLAIFALMGLMCAFAGLVNTARLAAGRRPPARWANSMRSPRASSAARRCAAGRAPSTAR